MKDKDFKLRVNEFRKRGLNKNLFTNILFLLLPAFMMMCVFLVSFYSFVISFFAIYLILPMFYTAERKIYYSLTGIGKPDFSYKDGYAAFFKERKGGIFGVISSLLLSFSLFLLSYFIFMNVFPSLCGAYPESMEVFKKISQMYQDPYQNGNEMFIYLKTNLYALSRPLSIMLSICLFLPIFVAIFFSVPTNLSHHYLATIVLPDIDKNLSASQARSLSKNSFGRPINMDRIQYNFIYNWPYMLAFILLYGGSSYLTSLIETTNSSLVPLIVVITPTVSLFYGFILQYFCIFNNYAIVETLAPSLHHTLPNPMKAYIAQAFKNPNYIHGEETSVRGPFILDVKRYEEYNVNENKEAERRDPDEKSVSGFVVDFSEKKEDDDK